LLAVNSIFPLSRLTNVLREAQLLDRRVCFQLGELLLGLHKVVEKALDPAPAVSEGRKPLLALHVLRKECYFFAEFGLCLYSFEHFSCFFLEDLGRSHLRELLMK
jgi:hypothetical protein